jgi:hypothetical protein
MAVLEPGLADAIVPSKSSDPPPLGLTAFWVLASFLIGWNIMVDVR